MLSRSMNGLAAQQSRPRPVAPPWTLDLRSGCGFSTFRYDSALMWPEHFPKGCDCPPSDAGLASGTIYRLAWKIPPRTLDFECQKLKSIRVKRALPPEADECMACGLSSYVTEDGLRKARNRIPGLREMHPIFAVFKEPIGKIKHTPDPITNPEHYTWWTDGTIALHVLFERLDLGREDWHAAE